MASILFDWSALAANAITIRQAIVEKTKAPDVAVLAEELDMVQRVYNLTDRQWRGMVDYRLARIEAQLAKVDIGALELRPLIDTSNDETSDAPVGEPDTNYRFNPAQPPAPPATSAQRHAVWGLGWDERK